MNREWEFQEKGSSKNPRLLLKTTLTALFAALIAAGAFIAIPIGPVPIVLQNLFAVLSGIILGPLMGGAAVGLYLLAGLLGFPVFAGGSGGIARFAGPTGGYLAGYLLAAVVSGLIAGEPASGKPASGKPSAGKPRSAAGVSFLRINAAVISGFLVIYVPGILWLNISGKLGWARALAAGFVPFVIGDILKGIGAVLIAPRLKKTASDFFNGNR